MSVGESRASTNRAAWFFRFEVGATDASAWMPVPMHRTCNHKVSQLFRDNLTSQDLNDTYRRQI